MIVIQLKLYRNKVALIFLLLIMCACSLKRSEIKENSKADEITQKESKETGVCGGDTIFCYNRLGHNINIIPLLKNKKYTGASIKAVLKEDTVFDKKIDANSLLECYQKDKELLDKAYTKINIEDIFKNFTLFEIIPHDSRGGDVYFQANFISKDRAQLFSVVFCIGLVSQVGSLRLSQIKEGDLPKG